MATIYYEAGTPAYLIPCQFLGWAKTPAHDVTGCFNAVVKLKRSRGAYHAGEVLHVPSWSVVTKSHVRDYHQYVRQAELPPRTEANTLPCRW